MKNANNWGVELVNKDEDYTCFERIISEMIALYRKQCAESSNNLKYPTLDIAIGKLWHERPECTKSARQLKYFAQCILADIAGKNLDLDNVCTDPTV